MSTYINSIEIAQQFVSDHELKAVATAILDTQRIHEESWSDETRKYKLTLSEASKQAVNNLKLNNFWVGIICNWNLCAWNDIQAWAQDIISSSDGD